MSDESSQPESAELPQEGGEEILQEQGGESAGGGEQAQLQDAVETAIANGASEKDVKNLIKEYQLKVNGKVVNKRIDLSDEASLKNELQLAAAARQSMQETANLKKLYEKEIGRLKQNPWEVLQELGMDPDQLAELRLQQRIEEMKKSPEQIEREKIQKELQEAREEAKKLKSEQESAKFERMKAEAVQQISDDIESVLDAHKTLPKSRHIVKRLADSMLWAMDQGFDNVTAEDVLPMVEKEWREEMSQIMDDSPEDFLEQLIGQRNIERMRQKRLNSMNQVKNLSAVKPTAASVQQSAAATAKPAEKMRQRDFFKSIGKKK